MQLTETRPALSDYGLRIYIKQLQIMQLAETCHVVSDYANDGDIYSPCCLAVVKLRSSSVACEPEPQYVTQT
jgi:hypothetical protein